MIITKKTLIIIPNNFKRSVFVLETNCVCGGTKLRIQFIRLSLFKVDEFYKNFYKKSLCKYDMKLYIL